MAEDSPYEGRGRSRLFAPPSGGIQGVEFGGSGGGSPMGSPSGGTQSGVLSSEPMPESESYPLLVRSALAAGTAGIPIELIANFYKIETKQMVVYHYDIDIHPARLSTSPSRSPEKPKSKIKTEEARVRFIKRFAPNIVRKLISDKVELFRNVPYAYDGWQNLYTAKKVPISFGESFGAMVTVDIDGRPEEFRVIMKIVDAYDMGEVLQYFANTMPMVSERAVSIYEIVLRSVMAQNYTSFQRKYYDMATVSGSPRTPICEFVQGFVSSVQATEIGLAVNIHNKMGTIVGQSWTKLLDVAQAVQPAIRVGFRLERAHLTELNRLVRHLKFTTNHARVITYTIDTIIERTPYDVTFEQAGKTISIADYFKTTHNLVVLHLPLVKTTGRRYSYIPLELCNLLPRQFLSNSKLNAVIQRELLAKSTLTPNIYFTRTTNIAKRVAASNLETQRAFGVEMFTKPVQLTGRVLPAPRQLNADKRGPLNQVGQAPAMWSIFCLSLDISDDDLCNFAEGLIRRAEEFGLFLNAPCPVTKVEITHTTALSNVFYNVRKKLNTEFILVGIPKMHPFISPAQMYCLVKHFCDQKFNIMSQCFRMENATRLPSGYFDQFLLKTNGKLGGRNAVLPQDIVDTLPFDPNSTLLVGIDVSHPSPSEHVISSVAAAVGAMDAMWSRYTASVRVQRRDSEEIIENLNDMIYELIMEWSKVHERRLPKNMIIFRDGVSDGQLDIVRSREIPLIQAAINKSGKPTNFMLILTNKCHHVRFALPKLNTEGKKPTWNVPSGTVVDTTVTSPKYNSFYLNSHFSPLGTSKPTRYLIAHDDLNLTNDQIQSFVFLTCYNSIRTRNVIASPTPVRYADLCAYRAKLHLEAQRDLIDYGSNQSEESLEAESEIIKRLNEMVKINDSLKDRLYYC